MDISAIAGAKMRIARSPRDLEQLRSSLRMGMYLEVKARGEKACDAQFGKQECAQMAMEIVYRLCGDNAGPNAPVFTPKMIESIDGILADIRANDPDLRTAASFMRWTIAVSELMRMENKTAETHLRVAVELNPRNAFAWCSLAYLAGFKGESHSAIVDAKKALEIDPGLYEAWIELGNAYDATGDHHLAMEAWQKAQSLNPGCVKTGDSPDPASLGLPGRDRPACYDVIKDEPDA